MPLGINSIVGVRISPYQVNVVKPCLQSEETTFLQVPTSSSLEESSSTSHMYLTFCSDINSIVGTHYYPVPVGVGNKA